MSSNTNGDGPSLRGPSNRSREQRRGYSISDGNMRRRDDPGIYDGRRDYSYCGRGSEQRSRDGRGYDERPRYSNGRGYDDYRYERPRADDRDYHEQRSRRYEEGRGSEGRGSDGRGYAKRSHYSDFRGYDQEMLEWKCTECGLYNSDVYEKCDRCGSRSGNMLCNHSVSPNDDEAVKVPETPKWPPPFESGGAAYDFHAASGMFYESISDFFYDPKTKLYYGNKQKVYYTHLPDQDPPFCALGAPPPTEETVNTVQSGAPKADDKKKIAISLKTKTLPGERETKKKPKAHKASKKVKVAPPEPKKQEKAKLELWAERGKEIREETGNSLPMTTSNKPVCLLCRRKFASIEKLKKHEELSALHRENLEKKKASEEAAKKAKESETAEYRDRALERRIMHGPETSVPMPLLPRDLDTSTTREAEVVRPEDNLGESNIGNQMLQKLGWKSGSSIGRGGEGEQARTQSTLVKDWEKIETLASSGHQSRVGPSSGSGVGN